MLILVLESSTTSAKAMLYCSDKGVLDVRTRAFTGLPADPATQDAQEIFRQLAALGREACLERSIDMIALSATWHSVLLCDRDMVPQTPVYLWSFTGAGDLCRRLREDGDYVSRFYRRTGCMVNASYPFFKLKYLREQGWQLENYLIMGQGTYNTYRLTGERIIMDSMASGTGLMNIHSREYDAQILSEIGIHPGQLSRIVTYKDTARLSEDGAKCLGLSPGIPVIAAGPDGGLNQVGVPDGVMTFSAGTSGALRMSIPRPMTDSYTGTWCYLSPKSWISGAATSGCCNCVDWARDRFFGAGTPYAEIEKNFGPPERTPVFLPFLFGERCPGWQDDRQAAFLDIKPFHTAHDMYHSVLEGTLYNLYQCFLQLAELNGHPRRILLSGGILHSAYWTQMCADIFGTDMEAADFEHGSMTGAAILALELMGVIKDASNFSLSSTRRIAFDPAMHEQYARKFQRYVTLYENNRN